MAVYTKISTKNILSIEKKYNLGKIIYFKGIKKGIENTNYLLKTKNKKFILTIFEKRVQKKDLPFFMNLMEKLSKYKVKVQLINPGFVKTRLTAKNNFAMPNIISSQKASKIILNNLPKNHFEIKFPLLFIIIMKYLSMLPYKLRFLLLKYVK